MSENGDTTQQGKRAHAVFRQPVPADLQELVGKKVIKRSLHCVDETKREKVMAEYAAEYEGIFEKLRGDLGKPVDAGIFSYTLYCLRDQV